MTEDRSLEEFVGDRSDDDAAERAEKAEEVRDAEEAEEAKDAEKADRGDEPPDKNDSDAPDPAVATYRWDPEGVDCAACGESVERLWNADEGFVCEACKEW